MTTCLKSSEDKLSSLPAEIQDSIFNCLTFRDRVRFSAVCSAWRSLILNWPEMWTTLSTRDGHTIVPDLVPYREYIQETDVKRLYIKATKHIDQEHVSEILDFVVDKGTHIEQVEFYVPNMDITVFVKLTSTCGDTLTRIVLEIDNAMGTTITPDTVMLLCPNLRKLYYFVVNPLKFKRNWESKLKGFVHKHLIDLALEVYDDDGTLDLTSLIQSAASLQRLSLSLDDVENTASMLPQLLYRNCPAFASLNVRDDIHQGIAHARDIDWKLQKSCGMEELVLLDSFERQATIESILCQAVKQSHSSLKILELSSRELFGKTTLDYLSTFTFPSLTRLCLTYERSDSTESAFCAFFARVVPNLHSLKLCIHTGLKRNSLQTIAWNAKCLEYLELDDCFDIAPKDLADFLIAMANRNVQTIVLRRMHGLTAQVLKIIANKYRFIDEITIDRCPSVSIQELFDFLNGWQSLERRVNLLNIIFPNTVELNMYLSSRGAVTKFLKVVESVAKRWTFKIQLFGKLVELFELDNTS